MKPTLEWLANPEIFEVNREKAHSDHTYTTKNGNLHQSLNGTWKFAYTEHPDNRPSDFYKNDFDVTNFDEITVPGHIQLQGHDKPQYVNTQYPWEGHEQLVPPQIPQKRNPVGSYVKIFDIDKALIGKAGIDILAYGTDIHKRTRCEEFVSIGSLSGHFLYGADCISPVVEREV